MLSGLLNSLSSVIVEHNLDLNNINKYFLVAILTSSICLVAFIFNLVKYKCKILIPKRRTQFYEHCDMNLDLSQRKDSIITNSKDKRYSEFREFSINAINNFSGIKNPNRVTDVVVNLDNQSTKDKEIRVEEFHSSASKDPAEHKEKVIEHKIISKSPTKKDRSEYLKTSDKFNSYLSKIDLCSVDKETNLNNVDQSKNTIGAKHSNRPIQLNDNNDSKGTDKKNSDSTQISPTNKDSRLSVITLSGSNIHSLWHYFKVSSIFSILQINDIVIYNMFFLNLAGCDERGYCYSIEKISLILCIFHVIYTILIPVTNTQIAKLVTIEKPLAAFKICVYLAIVFSLAFFIFDYFKSPNNLISVSIFAVILLFRNLSLLVVLTTYKLLYLKVSQPVVKEKISFFHNYISMLIRSIFGFFCCYFYYYFKMNYFLIFLVLGCLPICLLASNLSLVKNLVNLIDN